LDKFEPAKGEGTVCGAFVETDDNTGFAISIKPIRIGGDVLEGVF
jgi:calcineurin-like phosphoesterase